MRLPGGTLPAPFFLALCVWRLVPRREAAGTEEVVFGKVGGSVLLLCRNVSKEATEVVWFQGDPHSFPPLFSSRVAFPPDIRFSLVDNSALSITELRLQDEGNYTCREVLNKTDHEHRVQLLVGKIPSLESEPPKTCFVGDNVTLTCRVTESTPAARLTWLRGITQPEVEIQPGGRYLITQEGNVSRLTIQNCSQGTDGGCYICKAQNPVGLRELFVCLTVKQPENIVGVVGAVVVLSLLAILTVTGVVLYYNPLLCLRVSRRWSPQPLGLILLLVKTLSALEADGLGTQGSSPAACFRHLPLASSRELCCDGLLSPCDLPDALVAYVGRSPSPLCFCLWLPETVPLQAGLTG
ncbi:V-set and immunoglobulin domain-containing protein 10 isoform X4 [Falco naumanni]|uniref:V-set and immunoglobulin domain-containing protein 10 isoform X4 n=1 Tax=Falco naumanni TaxID=148594 RepID=UPI001ADEB9F3|nr:V-set and immunoglobulin domain-containing protein 10 isoform X4 [Falco naumanni]